MLIITLILNLSSLNPKGTISPRPPDPRVSHEEIDSDGNTADTLEYSLFGSVANHSACCCSYLLPVISQRLGNSDVDNASWGFLFASPKTVPWCIVHLAITYTRSPAQLRNSPPLPSPPLPSPPQEPLDAGYFGTWIYTI